MVDKKHLKIGVVVFALAALVIGLSVGFTQKSNKSTNNLSSSQAYGTYDIDASEECYDAAGPAYGKSGKDPSPKSGKSGRRSLTVPGTEDAEASAGIRRKLRDQLVGKLFTHFLLRINYCSHEMSSSCNIINIIPFSQLLIFSASLLPFLPSS